MKWKKESNLTPTLNESGPAGAGQKTDNVEAEESTEENE